MRRLTRFTLLFLYNPQKISPQHYYTENLGIQYIGAVLRQAGFDIQIINADYENLSHAQIIRIIQDYETQFLGMAPCYVTMSNALDIARAVKKQRPDMWVCLGGHHATFCSDDILKNEKAIDFVVRGEGEQTILGLAEAIESSPGGIPPINTFLSIDGLSFRFEENVFHNSPRSLIENLDSVPFPLRDPLDKVLNAGQHAMPLICTSRGCPANCSFCSTPQFYGRVWRARSAENVVDEIQEIIKQYGFTQFYLTDDQFAGKGVSGKRHVENLIEEIKRRQLHKDFDLHFFLMVRADFFRRRNEDVISQFSQVGFRDIFIGFESGDPTELKLYTKGATMNQYQEAIDILRRHNLFVEGGFIIFNPYATFTSLKEDAAFIKHLEVPLFGYYTKELMVLPGTRLFEKLLHDGMMIHHSYKQIQFKYRDDRVSRFHQYLRDFFSHFEEVDNRLFEAIDFEIKLAGNIERIGDERLKEKTKLFVSRSQVAYKEIAALNSRFFSSVADVFEQGKDSYQCISLQQRFEAEHYGFAQPIIKDYLELNANLGIIRS